MNKKAALLILSLLLLLTGAGPAEFRQAGDYSLSFPRDHGSHSQYETEWWYVTGHLIADDHRTYGFELVFFRIGVDPEADMRSNWAVPALYLSHFALTDDENKTFVHFERSSRGNFNRAGSSADKLKVWIDPWSLEMEGNAITLHASSESASLDLTLQPKKALVLHGDSGLSRKGPNPGEASYYSSFTRLEGRGEVSINSAQHKIEFASAWLDHEFTSSKLARGQRGWDWFAVQLSNGAELMVYQLRDEENKKTEFSSGTYVAANGAVTPLASADFTIQESGTWISPVSEISYPHRWHISVPKLGFQGTITPTVDNQELVTSSSTGVTYWEGRSKFVGVIESTLLRGDAYVELVGYNKSK